MVEEFKGMMRYDARIAMEEALDKKVSEKYFTGRMFRQNVLFQVRTQNFMLLDSSRVC